LNRSRRSFRTPSQSLESENAAVHLRQAPTSSHHDLRETVRGLLRAYRYLTQIASRGSLVVLSAPSARQGSHRAAIRYVGGMPFVSERWLGGTLTNYRTIRDLLKRLQQTRKHVAARRPKSPTRWI